MVTDGLGLARFAGGATTTDGDGPSDDESADGDVPSAACGGRWWLGDEEGVLSAAAPAAGEADAADDVLWFGRLCCPWLPLAFRPLVFRTFLGTAIAGYERGSD